MSASEASPAIDNMFNQRFIFEFFLVDNFRLVARVLRKVRICIYVCRRQRINFQIGRYGASGRNSTFPWPQISSFNKFVIADQVSSAETLPIQFSCSFIQDKISSELA